MAPTDNIVALDDCPLSKPQLLRVMWRQHKRLLGMCQIAKSLSATELEFAQETFEVFARNLDDLAAEMYAAQHGDAKAWFDSEFGPPRQAPGGR